MKTTATYGAWAEGPPPGLGQWWIVWETSDGRRRVLAIEVSTAVIDPGGEPLMKTLGGIAYAFAPNTKRITHHMPLVAPPAPRVKTRDRAEAEDAAAIALLEEERRS